MPKWACGAADCDCHYCMGQDDKGAYFCREGYYRSRHAGGAHDHDGSRKFKSLEDLAAHRMLHAFEGCVLEGSLDTMRNTR